MVKLIQNIIKINNIFKKAIFLFCLLSSITADVEWCDYIPSELSGVYKHTKGTKTQTIALVFANPRDIPYYIKVTVIPDEGIATPLLCFSPSDATCRSDRHSLNKKTDGLSSSIYVKKEEFDEGELNVLVTCEENTCGYTLRFDGGQAAEIEANSVFSYVVNSNNREMKFQVMGSAEEGSYFTIGVEGSSSIQINVDNIDENYSDHYLDTGLILTFPIINENSNILASFTVKGANIGDYLTLNIHIVYDDEAPDNLLYPNGPAVMGALSGLEGYFREECFPISAFTSEKFSNINKYYLTGKIYSKYGLFWLADESGAYMEETEQEIFDGYLSHLIETNGQKRSICFEFSYESTVQMHYVAYSISILEYKSLETIYNFYPPQIIGQFYRRMIPKGGYAVYQGAKVEQSDKRMNFNMYNRKGLSEMYVTKCSTYPNCLYDTKSLTYTKPKKINRMTIWETTIDKTYEALDSEKYVMLVYCKDDDNDLRGYCEVDTAIEVPGKTVTLIEKEQYSKFVLKGDKGILKIDLKGGMKIQRLTVDIMIYSGDVTFDLKGFDSKLNNGKLRDEEVELSHYKYFLSNKIHYHFNLAQLIFDYFEIEYNAVLNSFFTIKYEINPYNLIQLEENILSDESYLVQIDPTTSEKYKTIYLANYRMKAKSPFLTNFFALNCDFTVTRKEKENSEKEITFFDGYAQEIMYSNSQGYNSELYEYKIKINQADLSNYNHKMCMIYVASYESPDTESRTEIVVAENINQQIIFEDKFKSVRFLYPQADPEKDLAINVNIIDQAYYDIRIYFNNEEKAVKEYTITRSKIYYLSGRDIMNHCTKDTLCSIIVEASFSKYIPSIENTETPMIEITIRQILNTPSYLQKSIAKKDFTCGDRLYYLYTDIGKNEIGEVSVNFLRDFGNVYGKVVRKDQATPDEEANWRNIYRMPSKDWEDSLDYNGYIKKFEVGIEETQDCIEGCYLLLSIQISQIGDYVDDSKFYPFSIITRITPNNRAYTDIPKVVIQVNEYIIGNVDVAENERIYQFYEVWLTHDSYRIEFDFQSEVASLYVNLGGIRPTTKNADFKLLPPGRDSILYIDKYNLLQKAKEKKIKVPDDNSLQDINLVIGVWTDKTDSIDTEVFSLAVRLPNNDISLDIVEVNSDQKILCSPKYLNDKQFRCLFMVIYDDEDVQLEMPLLIHGGSVNQSALVYVHGSYIERSFYDEYDVSTLRARIPTLETAEYSTEKDDKDYIYTNLKEGPKKYFFVNVISDIEDDIFLLTSIPTYNIINKDNYQFYPNPSTEQLLFVPTEKLRLKFFTDSSLIVNIVTLGGEAMVSWADDLQTVFNLRGRGDRLTLTSGKISDEIVITKRTLTNDILKEIDDPGFVFYISYYIRNPDKNFDEVAFGKSTEVSYRDTDLPVYLYSKIGNYYSDLNIAITFMDSEIYTEGELAIPPINVRASLAKESSVYKSKSNPELSPLFERSFLGTYDPALKTATVFLSSSIIKNYNIKLEDNPTLYLSLEKNQNSDEIKYSKFNIEAQFTRLNGGLIPSEKTYNYGRHTNAFSNFYRLKKDINKLYMALEISFNSENLNFAITQSISRANMTSLIIKSQKARGKIFILLDTKQTKSNFIYLNIFRKTNPDQFVNPNLFNYVFKYININKEDDFKDYLILDNNNDLIINEKKDGNVVTIDCTFNKIDIERDKANITYFFKVVDNSTLNYGEECETIAVMESAYYTVYKRNPIDNNGKITLTASGEIGNWAYLQVIAQIQQDTILEYVAYKGIKNIRPPEKNNDNENTGGINTSVFIIVAVILIALIAGLVVVIFIFQQRNKSLLNQVKHVSFQQNSGTSNSNVDPDLLLQKSQQSEQ